MHFYLIKNCLWVAIVRLLPLLLALVSVVVIVVAVGVLLHCIDALQLLNKHHCGIVWLTFIMLNLLHKVHKHCAPLNKNIKKQKTIVASIFTIRKSLNLTKIHKLYQFYLIAFLKHLLHFSLTYSNSVTTESFLWPAFDHLEPAINRKKQLGRLAFFLKKKVFSSLINQNYS